MSANTVVQQNSGPHAVSPSQPGDDFEMLAPEAGMLASVREMPAWAISLIVHLLVLVLLGTLTHVTVGERDNVITSVLEDPDDEAYKFQATVTDQLGSDSDINKLSPSLSAAQHVGKDPQKEMQEQLDEELLEITKPVNDTIPQPNEAKLLETVEARGATEYTGGTEGAIDRLALEIAGSLRENKTLVVWLFDASGSLKKRRDTIADRFENVYRQVNQLNSESDKALKTAVASFGERVSIITEKPVDDPTQVVDAIRNIPEDKSGKENTFSAVAHVANKWLVYRTRMRRNVMIIVVTDERGDDFAKVETVAADLARYGIRVYCVGDASPFGREQRYVLWEYEDGYKEEIPVDAGPETVRAERLRLPFWGGSNTRKLERMSSGYGPYALTRLCGETGGVYFVAEDDQLRFDPAIMRDYAPDYRPIRKYVEDLATNKAKTALVQAAEKTRADRLRTLQLRFQAPNDNVLRQEITEAQKPIAEFDYHLQEMQRMLELGEKDRPKLMTPRWRASYDLAMGRVCAMRVRAFGYNNVLAEMKAEPKSFEKKDSNTWQLEPSRDVAGGPQVRKLAKKATKYLTRVIDEHAGTPWALLAERELGQPMGWQWVEAKRNYANTRRRPGDPDEGPDFADPNSDDPNQKKKKVKKRKRPVL